MTTEFNHSTKPVSLLRLKTLRVLASRLDPLDRTCVRDLPRDWIGLGETLGVVNTQYDVDYFGAALSPTIKVLYCWMGRSRSSYARYCPRLFRRFFGTRASIGELLEALRRIGRHDVYHQIQDFIADDIRYSRWKRRATALILILVTISGLWMICVFRCPSPSCPPTRPPTPRPPIAGMRHLKTVSLPYGGVNGVVWLPGAAGDRPGRIYVVCRFADRIHVFKDTDPFEELADEAIVLRDERFQLSGSIHVVGSARSRTLFVLEWGKKWIWRINVADGSFGSRNFEGIPLEILLTPTDSLVVLLNNSRQEVDDYYTVNTYEFAEVNPRTSSLLPAEIGKPVHMIFHPTKNCMLLIFSSKEVTTHKDAVEPVSTRLSEVTLKGHVIRSVTVPFPANTMEDAAVYDSDWLFVADWKRGELNLLNIVNQTMVDLGSHPPGKEYYPSRLCYVSEKNLLIVGRWTTNGTFSIFRI